MESKNPARFTLGRQSLLAPERHSDESELHQEGDGLEGMDPGFRLMFLAIEGDLDGIRELTNTGVSVNYRDIDNRTPLHVAACQGLTDVVALLLEKGAVVDPQDSWGSTVNTKLYIFSLCHYMYIEYKEQVHMINSPPENLPLADAIHGKNNDVIKLLEKHGAKPVGTFSSALWRGTEVAVKKLGDDVITNEEKVWITSKLCHY